MKRIDKGQYYLSILPNGDEVNPLNSTHLADLSDPPENEKVHRLEALEALEAYLGAVLKHLG